MLYPRDRVDEQQLYEDWLDPSNSLTDLEEEYGLRRYQVMDIIREIHDPDISEELLED